MTDIEICKMLKITLPMLKQLKEYVRHAEYEGWYWNPKESFEKRHKKIKEVLNIDEANKNETEV